MIHACSHPLRIVGLGVLCTALSASADLPGFRIDGRFLVAPTGEKVVLKGVNEETVWLGKTGIPAFPEIAKTKANVIRMSWDKSGTAAELDVAIANCVKNGMIPMPELHDATGNWAGLAALVDRWTSPEFVRVIKKHEKYLLVNIGNEVGQTVSDADYKSGYNTAVQRMRRAGIRVPLIIDASGYGQNYQAISNNAPDIMAKDSLKNVMFSVHMYWPLKWNGNSKATVEKKVRDALDDAVAKGIPLIVGEFAEAFTDAGVVAPGDSIPFRTIIAECNKREIGWIPWSWRGNKPQTDLDMSPSGTYEGLTAWGKEIMVTDPNSVQNTAKAVKYIVDGLASKEFPSDGTSALASRTGTSHLRINALAGGWIHVDGLETDGSELALRNLSGAIVGRIPTNNSSISWRPAVSAGTYELVVRRGTSTRSAKVTVIP